MPSVWLGRIRPTGWAFLAGLGALACVGGDGGGGPVDPGDEPVASVTITPGQATIAPADAVTLTATVKGASGTVLTGRAVTWSANHPDLASVSTTGVVTGQADGVVLVTATSETKSSTATITVHTSVAAVEVTPTSGTILNGETLQLTAVTKDAAGDPLSRPVTWSANPTAVATVSAAGLVTGVGAGSVTITATAEGQEDAATITVRVLDVSGDWTFTETFADDAVGLSCTDQATLTLTPAGAGFTGSADQTGECTLNGEPFDNSGTYAITDGFVRKDSIGFTEPGEPDCEYTGTLAGDPPTGGSGDVSCVGTITGLGSVNLVGTWQITR